MESRRESLDLDLAARPCEQMKRFCEMLFDKVDANVFGVRLAHVIMWITSSLVVNARHGAMELFIGKREG